MTHRQRNATRCLARGFRGGGREKTGRLGCWSGECVVGAFDDRFGSEHHHDQGDERDQSTELDVITEDDVDRAEDDELRAELQHPRCAKRCDFHNAVDPVTRTVLPSTLNSWSIFTVPP